MKEEVRREKKNERKSKKEEGEKKEEGGKKGEAKGSHPPNCSRNLHSPKVPVSSKCQKVKCPEEGECLGNNSLLLLLEWPFGEEMNNGDER